MAKEKIAYIVKIKDNSTGETEEKEFTNYNKAVALCEMVALYNGENKTVQLLNEKGDEID